MIGLALALRTSHMTRSTLLTESTVRRIEMYLEPIHRSEGSIVGFSNNCSHRLYMMRKISA